MAKKTKALLPAVLVLLVLAATSPASAQEDASADSAQYPEDGGPISAQYGDAPAAEDEPPATQTTQYAPNDAETQPEDDCDPALEECSSDETGYFVDDAAGDAQQTTNTLNEPTVVSAPSEKPAAVPEQHPPVTAPLSEGDAVPAAPPQTGAAPVPEGNPEPAAPLSPPRADVALPGPEPRDSVEEPAAVPEQYPPATVPLPKADAAPVPRPFVPRPEPVPEGVGPKPATPPADSGAAEVAPPAPKAGNSASGPRDAPSVAAASERDAESAPTKDAPEGEARGEDVGGSRPEPTVEEREVAQRRELAASPRGASTVYTLGGSALLIAGAAAVGRFLKR